jgi:phosphomannomutase
MNKYQKEYVEFLRGFLAPQKKLKVVFDCSNGTTGGIMKGIADYGLRIKNNKILNSIPNGNFPAHGPNPLKPGAMKQIQKEVLKNKADLGVIFDADGDRAFFIDDKGRVVDPDIIASLLIWYLKPKKIVITEITSSVINNLRPTTDDLQLIRSENGGYFIKNLMIKNNADFGCERSGHYYFALRSFSEGGFFYMDSGILAAIHIMNAISKLPYKLSDFVDLSPRYYRSGDINIKLTNNQQPTTNNKNAEKVNNLFKKIEKYFSHDSIRQLGDQVQISHIDGLRMDFKILGNNITSHSLSKNGIASRSLGGGWWFNIQLSNTEPLLRLNIEASSKQILAKQNKMLLKLLRNGI